jgi:hypothetical protein
LIQSLSQTPNSRPFVPYDTYILRRAQATIMTQANGNSGGRKVDVQSGRKIAILKIMRHPRYVL